MPIIAVNETGPKPIADKTNKTRKQRVRVVVTAKPYDACGLRLTAQVEPRTAAGTMRFDRGSRLMGAPGNPAGSRAWCSNAIFAHSNGFQDSGDWDDACSAFRAVQPIA
jgi:hypothetical protein